MSSRDLRMTELRRQNTPDRPWGVRIFDYLVTRAVPDILQLFKVQAARCCNCSVKGCNMGPIGDVAPEREITGCPFNTLIPDWLAKVASPPVIKALEGIMTAAESASLTEEGLTKNIDALLKDPACAEQLYEAFQLAMKRNVLSEFLGEVCPQANGLCEGGSVRTASSCVAGAAGWKPITIGSIESLIGRIGRQAGWLREMLEVPLDMDRHISIIGGGPGGMAAAMMFRREGYRVTLYMRENHLGGLLMYGLPGTKLDKNVVLAYEEIFKENSGIVLKTGTQVGPAEIARIERASDRVILALGAQTPKQIGIEGENLPGVVQSLDFLGASIRDHNLGEGILGTPEGKKFDARGKHVIVIGGGDTSMDCVREAIRERAESVTVVYRGPLDQMRAIEKEINRAKEEGVIFVASQAPARIEGDEYVREMVFTSRPPKMAVTRTSADGSTVAVPAREIRHAAGMVVNAIGFTAEDSLAARLGIPGLQQEDGSNAIVVSHPAKDFRIMIADGEGPARPSDKFYAIGDVVQIRHGKGDPVPIHHGKCLAVWAAENAGRAFDQIHKGLTLEPI